jgi:transposase
VRRDPLRHREGRVEHVTRDPRKESLASYFGQFSREELARIEGVAMDMRARYLLATLAAAPDAAPKIQRGILAPISTRSSEAASRHGTP